MVCIGKSYFPLMLYSIAQISQACWSATGMQMYAGRRNGTIDVWDVRYLGTTSPKSTPRLLKTIRNPASSGMVACVVAFPDGKHLAW
jgi:transcriptional activator SPT8